MSIGTQNFVDDYLLKFSWKKTYFSFVENDKPSFLFIYKEFA